MADNVHEGDLDLSDRVTGNFLADLFGTKDLVHKTNQFKEFLEQNNQVPMVHFDGENDLENRLSVIRRNGEKATFKQIYDELDGYPLNRGPIFYFSECVVDYHFETFVIFVQDGWILEDPYEEGAIALYPWDVWGEVLFTKHRDMDAPVILLAYPTQDSASELSISPKLDIEANVVVSPSERGPVTAKYTDDLKAVMTFAYSILKRYWQVVDDNRDKSTNSIPADMLYILNEKSISSLKDELKGLETQSGPEKAEPVVHEGDLNLSHVKSPEGLELPDKVTGSLFLSGLTSAEGVTFPEHVGGDLNLGALTSADGLKLPKHVEGDLRINRLTSAKGLTFPGHVGGGIGLVGLTSAEGVKLPEHVGGDLYLSTYIQDEYDQEVHGPAELGGKVHFFKPD